VLVQIQSCAPNDPYGVRVFAIVAGPDGHPQRSDLLAFVVGAKRDEVVGGGPQVIVMTGQLVGSR
jgi:hypothetical protein